MQQLILILEVATSLYIYIPFPKGKRWGQHAAPLHLNNEVKHCIRFSLDCILDGLSSTSQAFRISTKIHSRQRWQHLAQLKIAKQDQYLSGKTPGSFWAVEEPEKLKSFLEELVANHSPYYCPDDVPLRSARFDLPGGPLH